MKSPVPLSTLPGLSVFVVTVVALATYACSGDGPLEFPDLDGDWVVEQLFCEGSLAPRMIRVEDGAATYVRGGECGEPGEPFWDASPTDHGTSTTLFLAGDQTTATADGRDEHSVLLDIAGDQALMRRVSPDLNPTATEPRGFDLSGTWWMDGYPCHDEDLEQLVFALHSGSVLSLRKDIGDECVTDGTSFFDGQVSEATIEGEAELIEWDPFTWEGDEEPAPVPATGQVRTDDFFTLNVFGQVRLRRVLSEPL